MQKHDLTPHLDRVFVFGVIAMAGIVVASNVLVQILLGNWLTYGAFVYPLAFLVTDVINRAAGPARARRVVLAGFLVGVLCSLAGSMIEGDAGPLVTLRVAMGSGTAFLVAQLLDVAVFDRMRRGRWWRAPLASSLIGSIVDTLLFFAIAFSSVLTFLEPSNDVGWANAEVALLGMGPILPLWMSLAIADLLVKLSIALVALIPFRMATVRMPGHAG